eukprot:g318.t1
MMDFKSIRLHDIRSENCQSVFLSSQQSGDPIVFTVTKTVFGSDGEGIRQYRFAPFAKDWVSPSGSLDLSSLLSSVGRDVKVKVSQNDGKENFVEKTFKSFVGSWKNKSPPELIDWQFNLDPTARKNLHGGCCIPRFFGNNLLLQSWMDKGDEDSRVRKEMKKKKGGQEHHSHSNPSFISKGKYNIFQSLSIQFIPVPVPVQTETPEKKNKNETKFSAWEQHAFTVVIGSIFGEIEVVAIHRDDKAWVAPSLFDKKPLHCCKKEELDDNDMIRNAVLESPLLPFSRFYKHVVVQGDLLVLAPGTLFATRPRRKKSFEFKKKVLKQKRWEKDIYDMNMKKSSRAKESNASSTFLPVIWCRYLYLGCSIFPHFFSSAFCSISNCRTRVVVENRMNDSIVENGYYFNGRNDFPWFGLFHHNWPTTGRPNENLHHWPYFFSQREIIWNSVVGLLERSLLIQEKRNENDPKLMNVKNIRKRKRSLSKNENSRADDGDNDDEMEEEGNMNLLSTLQAVRHLLQACVNIDFDGVLTSKWDWRMLLSKVNTIIHVLERRHCMVLHNIASAAIFEKIDNDDENVNESTIKNENRIDFNGIVIPRRFQKQNVTLTDVNQSEKEEHFGGRNSNVIAYTHVDSNNEMSIENDDFLIVSLPPAEWQCSFCTLFNRHKLVTCHACREKRPSSSQYSLIHHKIKSGSQVRVTIKARSNCGKRSKTKNSLLKAKVMSIEKHAVAVKVRYVEWSHHYDEYRLLNEVIPRDVSQHSHEREKNEFHIGDPITVRWGSEKQLFNATVREIYKGPLLKVTFRSMNDADWDQWILPKQVNMVY